VNGPEHFMDWVRARDPSQPEFYQAVGEVVRSLWPFLAREGQRFLDARILERMVEPDRVIRFRVVWTDDRGQIRINRG
jgi:glutamate dehydrogenase (NADP+)